MPRKPSTRKSKKKAAPKEDKVMTVMAKNLRPNDVLLYPRSKFQHTAREIEVERVIVGPKPRNTSHKPPIDDHSPHVTVIARRTATGLHTGMHMGMPTTKHRIRRPA